MTDSPEFKSNPVGEPSVMEMFSLAGRVALVTGASGYLGRALADALAEAGATVVVSSRSEERARQVAAELPRPSGAEHYGVQLDYVDEDAIQNGFASAVDRAGKVDVLVNNGHAPTDRSLWNTTEKEFVEQLAMCAGYFSLARMVRDHAVSRAAEASIVMLGSMYGVVGSYPEVYEGLGGPNPVAYQALKGGVLQLTRHLSVYWARDRVRVNAISPGPFPPASAPPELVVRLAEKAPLGRVGRPGELKGAVILLASDAGSYITGQNLLIDGGWTAW